jgi:hypothetical protein
MPGLVPDTDASKMYGANGCSEVIVQMRGDPMDAVAGAVNATSRLRLGTTKEMGPTADP